MNCPIIHPPAEISCGLKLPVCFPAKPTAPFNTFARVMLFGEFLNLFGIPPNT